MFIHLFEESKKIVPYCLLISKIQFIKTLLLMERKTKADTLYCLMNFKVDFLSSTFETTSKIYIPVLSSSMATTSDC